MLVKGSYDKKLRGFLSHRDILSQKSVLMLLMSGGPPAGVHLFCISSNECTWHHQQEAKDHHIRVETSGTNLCRETGISTGGFLSKGL